MFESLQRPVTITLTAEEVTDVEIAIWAALKYCDPDCDEWKRLRAKLIDARDSLK